MPASRAAPIVPSRSASDSAIERLMFLRLWVSEAERKKFASWKRSRCSTARSRPLRLGINTEKATPSRGSTPASTSDASESWGITSGRTNEVSSIRGSPESASIPISRSLWSVGITSGSFWNPSRGPTSRILTSLGSSVISPSGYSRAIPRPDSDCDPACLHPPSAPVACRHVRRDRELPPLRRARGRPRRDRGSMRDASGGGSGPSGSLDTLLLARPGNGAPRHVPGLPGRGRVGGVLRSRLRPPPAPHGRRHAGGGARALEPPGPALRVDLLLGTYGLAPGGAHPRPRFRRSLPQLPLLALLRDPLRGGPRGRIPRIRARAHSPPRRGSAHVPRDRGVGRGGGRRESGDRRQLHVPQGAPDDGERARLPGPLAVVHPRRRGAGAGAVRAARPSVPATRSNRLSPPA